MFPRFKGARGPKYDRSPIHKDAPSIIGVDPRNLGKFHATPAKIKKPKRY